MLLNENLAYIFPNCNEILPNVIHSLYPFSSMKRIIQLVHLQINVMSRIIESNIKYESIVVVLNKQMEKNLHNFIKLNIDDNQKLNTIQNIANIMSSHSLHNKLKNKSVENLYIEERIEKILSFNKWPLDVYYVFENNLDNFHNHGKYYLFKKASISIDDSFIASPIFVSPVCHHGFGDFMYRFSKLDHIVQYFDFISIVKNDKSYSNSEHNGQNGILNFYNSPLYQSIKTCNIKQEFQNIDLEPFLSFILFDPNFVKSFFHNSFFMVNLHCISIRQEQLISTRWNKKELLQNSISLDDIKTFLGEFTTTNPLVLFHFRRGDLMKLTKPYTKRNNILNFKESLNILLKANLKETQFDIVILSDDVSDQFKKNMSEELKNTWFDFYDIKQGTTISKNNKTIFVLDKCLGSNEINDFKLLKYIYYCDYCIRPSSCLIENLVLALDKEKIILR